MEEEEEVEAAPVQEDSDGSEDEHKDKQMDTVKETTPEASLI
jgi:hypothetical protein